MVNDAFRSVHLQNIREKLLLVRSAAQYSQVIRIFDMFTSCYKTLTDPRRNIFIT